MCEEAELWLFIIIEASVSCWAPAAQNGGGGGYLCMLKALYLSLQTCRVGLYTCACVCVPFPVCLEACSLGFCFCRTGLRGRLWKADALTRSAVSLHDCSHSLEGSTLQAPVTPMRGRAHEGAEHPGEDHLYEEVCLSSLMLEGTCPWNASEGCLDAPGEATGTNTGDFLEVHARRQSVCLEKSMLVALHCTCCSLSARASLSCHSHDSEALTTKQSTRRRARCARRRRNAES